MMNSSSTRSCSSLQLQLRIEFLVGESSSSSRFERMMLCEKINSFSTRSCSSLELQLRIEFLLSMIQNSLREVDFVFSNGGYNDGRYWIPTNKNNITSITTTTKDFDIGFRRIRIIFIFIF